jgi:two-component system phosphate regulon sensor histidine kinase PhoR
MDTLKFRKTYKFAFYSAILLSVLALGLLFILHLFQNNEFSLKAVFFFGIIMFISSFLIIQYRVERFIYKRVQKIYKDVSILDISELDKNTITSNMETLSKNVKRFAEDKRLEIETLKEKESYRREFLGNISHELKTPLFTVQGYILTLLEGAIDDKDIRLKYLERANNGVERLNHIVKDLDMISRLEMGDLSINYQHFNIITLIEDVFNLLEIESRKRNISLILNRFYEYPIIVNADKNRIQQVLINLVANAIYYGNSNGSTIVSINLFDKNKVIIAVKDDGSGIDSDKLPRLFERFYRVDKSRARNQGGSGLGLSIVKHIIEAHNEQVFVESEVGKGSTFSFTLQSVS